MLEFGEVNAGFFKRRFNGDLDHLFLVCIEGVLIDPEEGIQSILIWFFPTVTDNVVPLF